MCRFLQCLAILTILATAITHADDQGDLAPPDLSVCDPVMGSQRPLVAQEQPSTPRVDLSSLTQNPVHDPNIPPMKPARILALTRSLQDRSDPSTQEEWESLVGFKMHAASQLARLVEQTITGESEILLVLKASENVNLAGNDWVIEDPEKINILKTEISNTALSGFRDLGAKLLETSGDASIDSKRLRFLETVRAYIARLARLNEIQNLTAVKAIGALGGKEALTYLAIKTAEADARAAEAALIQLQAYVKDPAKFGVSHQTLGDVVLSNLGPALKRTSFSNDETPLSPPGYDDKGVSETLYLAQKARFETRDRLRKSTRKLMAQMITQLVAVPARAKEHASRVREWLEDITSSNVEEDVKTQLDLGLVALMKQSYEVSQTLTGYVKDRLHGNLPKRKDGRSFYFEIEARQLLGEAKPEAPQATSTSDLPDPFMGE